MESKIGVRISTMALIVFTLMIATGCQAGKPVPLTIAAVTMNAKTDKAANLEQMARYMAEAAVESYLEQGRGEPFHSVAHD